MRNFIIKYSLPNIRMISKYMKLISTKAGSLPFADKQTGMVLITNCVKLLSCTDCIRDLGVLIDTKLHFHQQEDNIFTQAIKLLGLIQMLLSSLHSPFCLYTALQSDSSWNMPLLCGFLSLFQMLVGWSTSSRSLHLFVIIIFSVTYITAMILS